MGSATLSTIKMDNKNEMLCAYAAMILADAETDVTADNLNAVIKAAGASVPAYYAATFEKVNGKTSVTDLLENAGKIGGGGGGGGAAASSGAAPAAAAKKKTTTEEEEDMAPATGLFDGGDDY